MPSYSKKSIKKLHQCDSRLIKLFNRVIEIYDNTILTGFRGKEEQNRKYAYGGSKVKWPNSKHNSKPSKAIDAAPYPIPENWGEDSWKDKVHFYEFAAIVKYEAKRMDLNIRWGGDWDGDNDYKDQTFDDLIHFEIVE